MSMSEITVTLTMIFMGAIVLFFGIGFIVSRFTKSEVSFETANPERDLRKSTILDPEEFNSAETTEYNDSENLSIEFNYSNSFDDRYTAYSYNAEPVMVYSSGNSRKSPKILNPRINNTRILFH